METLQTLTEFGIIGGLFVMIIVASIWKGIPFVVTQFTTVRKDFLKALSDQQQTFENTMKSVTEDVIKRLEETESYHKEHLEEMRQLRRELNKFICNSGDCKLSLEEIKKNFKDRK